MRSKKIDAAPSLDGAPGEQPPDPQLIEAVNQLVWLIADEVVGAAQEAMWLEEMLPEPGEPKTRIASKN